MLKKVVLDGVEKGVCALQLDGVKKGVFSPRAITKTELPASMASAKLLWNNGPH